MRVPDILARHFGTNPDSVSRFRLGRGVLGNTTYAFAALSAGIVGITWALRGDPFMALVADAGLLVVFLVYLLGTYIFAHHHPDMAMLGDLEWLQWSQNQMAAKDKALVINQTPVVGSGKTITDRSGHGNA
jgi:hypothetical protein